MKAARKRPVAWLRRLRYPRSWPVRWRLAAVSSGLTLIILLLFGGAIGQIATSRIRDDFNNEVHSASQRLAGEVHITSDVFGREHLTGRIQLDTFVLSDAGGVRIYDGNENLIAEAGETSELGPLRAGSTTNDDMRVSTAGVFNEAGQAIGYVQYGRNISHVEATVDRVWLLIAAGIFGGTLLAILAGVAIAGRAMRPIASLTATARKIATTRDPSQRMPKPVVEDEVGELALTLEEMLRSLDAAQTEREAAMQKQREFVADASHELRTPLTSVLANLELLQASLDRAEQAEDREMVDSALRSSRRMSRLVSDLLLLARADAGQLGKHRRCDLAEIAGDAAAEAAPLMGERELLLDNDRPLRVEGNPDELHRMVLNLLDNAARHTPERARIELSLHAEDGQAVVEVADNGPGIPPALRAHIFDRFVRGDGPADTARGNGTGLGLAIVSAVAESHGGSVEATESPAGGALFRARIPLAEAEKTPADHLSTL